MPLKAVVYDYALNTSTHGIAHIAKSKHCSGKLFWGSVCIMCLSFLMFQITSIVQRYLKYEKTTSLRLEVNNQRFPAVTVCSLNPFKKEAVLDIPDISRLLEAYEEASITQANGQQVKTPSRVKRQIQTTVRLDRRSFPCECANNWKGVEECIPSPAAIDKEICICSVDGHLCHACRTLAGSSVAEEISKCIQDWGEKINGSKHLNGTVNYICNPSGCHAVVETRVLAPTEIPEPRGLVNASSGEIMQPCMCDDNGFCYQSSSPDPVGALICMCSRTNGCRICRDLACSAILISIFPCVCTSISSCKSIGEDMDIAYQLCYCDADTKRVCRLCVSEECIESYAKGWVGRPSVKDLFPVESVGEENINGTPVQLQGNHSTASNETTNIPGAVVAKTGACVCNQRNLCIWSTINDASEIELNTPCVCDTETGVCEKCDRSSCKEVFQNLVDQAPKATTPAPEADFGFENKKSDQIANQAKAEKQLLNIAARLNGTVRASLGYEIDDFILQCAFNTKPCHMIDDFAQSQDPTYGNCYTFNPNISNATKESDRAGPVYGLTMILFTDLTTYLLTSKQAGARVVIHDQAHHPFPDSIGYNAPVGFSVNFGVRKKESIRLSDPYGDCVMDKSEVSYYFYARNYTVEGCFRSCLQRLLTKSCGCADPQYPAEEDSDRLCESTTQMNCLSSIASQLSEDETSDGCRCPLPCREPGFDVTISSSFWPLTTARQVAGCDEVKTLEKFNTTCALRYREMAVKVQIYFEQLSNQVIFETPAFPDQAMIADISSQVGLFIGLSAVSAVEFLIFVIKIVLHLVYDGCSFCTCADPETTDTNKAKDKHNDKESKKENDSKSDKVHLMFEKRHIPSEPEEVFTLDTTSFTSERRKPPAT